LPWPAAIVQEIQEAFPTQHRVALRSLFGGFWWAFRQECSGTFQASPEPLCRGGLRRKLAGQTIEGDVWTWWKLQGLDEECTSIYIECF
jgi:hypothetical protein